MHDLDQGPLALDLHGLDLHVDRQGLLDRRVHPAAGAEAVLAAEHDQAGAHVVDVGLEQPLLRLGERVLGDVAEDHGVERLELAEVVGERVAPLVAAAADAGGDQDLDLQLLLAEGPDQLGVLAPGPLDQEDLRRAPGVGEPGGHVVDRPAVARALLGDELGGEGVEARLGDELLEREDVHAPAEVDRHRLLVAGGGDAPVVGVLLEDLQGPPGRLAGPDDDVDVDRLALLDVGGQRDLLDQDFLVVEVVDRQDVDLDAQLLGGEGLLDGVAAVLVAVGDEDDPPGGVLGEGGQGELDGAAEVGVLAVDGVLDPQASGWPRSAAGGPRRLGSLPKTITPVRSSLVLFRFFESSETNARIVPRYSWGMLSEASTTYIVVSFSLRRTD